ncbi:MAG: ATP-dependent acyl-CoA ligase [Solirubrobacteraceae bacterium]
MSPILKSPLRELPLREQTLPRLFERQVRLHGERTLLRCGELTRSFAEMRDAVATAAGTLAQAGIAPGDRVALMCENRVEVLDFVFGCAWLGATAVPLNTALRGLQLEHQLLNSGARVIAMDSVLVEVLGALPTPPPELREVWALDGVPESVPEGYLVREPPAPGAPLPPTEVDPGHTAAILYTSGTTGPAKGVQCPQAQFFWWGVLMGEVFELTQDDVLYTCLPVFHTNALNAFVQALLAGATFHLGPRFSASRFWNRVAEANASVTYLLGAMVNILVSRPPGPEDAAHRVRVALAPATPANIFEGFRERFGVQLLEGYGSTETNAALMFSPAEQRAGVMGPVREGFHARVVDEHDEPVPDGTAGELLLRHDPPFAFATGYFAMPEKTVEAWTNLWFHTGDRVVREADGCYRFLDRIKDAIRRRGENISSFEVEQALTSHPAVSAAAVFPVASELAEDEVAAAIVLVPDVSCEPVEIIRHCEPLLAYFAIPRYIRFVAELPLTTNGKVRKSVLRDAGILPDDWDREREGVQLRRAGARSA